MITITDKSLCSGCHACMSICPKKCIVMQMDNEGFLYPHGNKTDCIDCGMCEKVCQSINPIISGNIGKAYACINNNMEVRLASSSGGIFTLIAEKILEEGGVVFGAGYDENFNVHHVAVESKEQLSLLRGAKYVQSTIGDAYVQAKDYLDEGRYVLFTGTPCQIDGLLHYLNRKYEKLYTQDLVCHGAPSPLVWRRYIQCREEEASASMSRIFLRYKKYSWKAYFVQFEFSNNTEYEQIFSKDLFMKGFLANLYLRPSCYNCHSKTLKRNSDITLADFWGINRIYPEFDDDKGTSLVFVNSEKGSCLFEKIIPELMYKRVDILAAVKANPSAYKSVAMHPKRKSFFKKIDKMTIDKLIKKYNRTSIKIKVKLFIKRIIYILKRVLNKQS